MGHKNEQITEVNYNKVTDQQRAHVFMQLQAGDLASEEDMALLLAFHEHRLTPGTLEHTKAAKLSLERMKRYQ